MCADEVAARVDAVRAFNRFWTARIGALDAGLLETAYSLTEARVLFELAQQDELEVAELRGRLELDPGYLSRILARFRAAKLIGTAASSADARRQVATLTRKGRKVYDELDRRAAGQMQAMIGKLPEDAQRRVVGAMGEITAALADGGPAAPGYLLRAPIAGELGWVVQRHGALYAAEYGWNDEFEALVARIVADYVAQRDPAREAVWIAEVAGKPVGCVFCVRKDARTARLRLLLVEPSARGMGIGARLVEECIRFARRVGYKRMVLWTNDVLHGARRIYERAGFRLVDKGRHRAFGKQLVEQTWALELTEASGAAARGG